MVTVVVLQVVGVLLGAVVLVALALSVGAARAGRLVGAGGAYGADGAGAVPLVGGRHAQFGDATAAAASAARRPGAPVTPAAPLRLVHPAPAEAQTPRAAHAA